MQANIYGASFVKYVTFTKIHRRLGRWGGQFTGKSAGSGPDMLCILLRGIHFTNFLQS